MNTHAFISHHLYVAAIGQEAGPAMKPGRPSNEASQACRAKVVRLEVMPPGKPMPARVTRRLRATSSEGNA